MTRKTDAAPGGVEVRPTGVGGSYVIDPATGLPLAAPVAVPAAPVAPVAPEPAAEPAQSGKKETGK